MEKKRSLQKKGGWFGEKPWGFEETQLALEEKRGGVQRNIDTHRLQRPSLRVVRQARSLHTVQRVTVGTWADGLVPHCVFLEWESWVSGGGVGGQLASWGAREGQPCQQCQVGWWACWSHVQGMAMGQGGGGWWAWGGSQGGLRLVWAGR